MPPDADGQLRRHGRPGPAARLPPPAPGRDVRGRSRDRGDHPDLRARARVDVHRERPGPPGRPVPGGVGADRRRPARAGHDRTCSPPRSGLGRRSRAGGSRSPTSRSSAGPATTPTGSPRTAATSPTMTSTRWSGDSAELLAGQVDPVRLGPVHPADRRAPGDPAALHARRAASSTAPAGPRHPPGRRPTPTCATSSTTRAGGAGWATATAGPLITVPGPDLRAGRSRAPAVATWTTAATAWCRVTLDRRRPGPDRVRPDRRRAPGVRPGRAAGPHAWPTSWSRRFSGPTSTPDDATLEQVEEIVRRAFETVRLMNTAAMNAGGMAAPRRGGGPAARADHGARRSSTPPRWSSCTRACCVALRSGAAPWFADVLRDHDEVGDLSDRGRRKMPAHDARRRRPASGPDPPPGRARSGRWPAGRSSRTPTEGRPQ